MNYYEQEADEEFGKYVEKLREEGFGPEELYEDPDNMLGQITGLCRCGSHKDFELLWEVLEWCARAGDDEHAKRKEPFCDKGCYCDAAHELAAKVLDRANLVSHGTGIGWPWATALGYGLLKWKKRIEVRKNEHPTKNK